MKNPAQELETYKKRQSFVGASLLQIKNAASNVCRGWASVEAMKWPENSIIGGTTRGTKTPSGDDGDTIITKAAALQTIYQLADANMVAWRNGISFDEAKRALAAWKTSFTAKIQVGYRS